MKEVLALIAYGLLLNGAGYMIYYWGRIAYRRAVQLGWKSLHRDTYMILATALSIMSFGFIVLYTSRATSSMAYGAYTVSKDSILSWLVLLGLYACAFAQMGFVWAVTIDRRSLVWKMFCLTSVAWMILAIAWATIDPANSFPKTDQFSHMDVNG